MTLRRATPFATPEIIRNGACQCCGEVHPLPLDQPYHAQCDADTWATAHCDCLEGENDRQSSAEQERYNEDMLLARRKREREEYQAVATEAAATLDRLFGNGAQSTCRVRLDREVVEYLHATAMLVYMGTIGKVSIPVTEGEAARIFVKKGTLTIARKAVKEQSLEVLV